MQPKYRSTKRYGHNQGLSSTFRQWRAEGTHCKLIHGYALSVELEFGTNELDERNWVQNFGGLKEVKNYLTWLLDHTTVVAEDDPEIDTFYELDEKGLIALRVIPDVGCEKFAEHIFYATLALLDMNIVSDRVKLMSVRVWEHEANSASFINPILDLPEASRNWIGSLHNAFKQNRALFTARDYEVLDPKQWESDIEVAIDPVSALIVDYGRIAGDLD
jgi:6-pyruvoyltetrahydropterin/6-carboxytetrahydropterin synthase